MHDDGVDVWGDGSTYKGNDIERFYRYGLLVNPNLRIYKPWLDQRLRRRARRPAEMSEFLDRAQPAVPRPARRRRTRPTPTSGAPPTRRSRSRSWARAWRSSSRSWASPTTAIDVEIAAETVSVRFEEGWPVAINGNEFESQVDLVMEANAIGGRHGLGMSDQIENRIIEAKSRGIYEGPGLGAAAHLLRAAGHRHPQREHASRTTARWAAASAACCTRAAGSTRRA